MKNSRAKKPWIPESDFKIDSVFRPEDAKALLDNQEKIVENLLESIWLEAHKKMAFPNLRFEIELELGEVPANTNEPEYNQLEMSLKLAALNDFRSKGAIVDYKEFDRDIGDGPWLELVGVRVRYYPGKFAQYYSGRIGRKVSDKLEFDQKHSQLIFGDKVCKIPAAKKEYYVCLVMFQRRLGELVPQDDILDYIGKTSTMDKKANKMIKDTLSRLNNKIKLNLGLDNAFSYTGEHLVRKY